MKYDVFISYSSKDQKVVEAMCTYLEQHKVRCFVAYRDIPNGSVWAKAIVDALEGSGMVVAVFSEDYNLSEQVDREIEIASEDNKPILIFRISDASFKGAKRFYLNNTSWVGAFPHYETMFDALLTNVRMMLSQSDGGSPVHVSATAIPATQVTSTASSAPSEASLTKGGEDSLFRCGSSKPFKDGTVKVSQPIANSTLVSNNRDFVLNVEGVEYPMVFVESGTFNMGSEDSDAGGEEMPVHQVNLSGYYIGKYQVTQELWEAVMGRNPSYFKGPRLPVESVSWEDCQEFVSKLNSLTGKNFKLPTEAQWEFAARGGNRSKGKKYSGSNTLKKVAKFNGSSYEVGAKVPNELGIFNMSGNVCEWCQDSYINYSPYPQTDPIGVGRGPFRVARGGCWSQSPAKCRVSSRKGYNATTRTIFLGLRLCL